MLLLTSSLAILLAFATGLPTTADSARSLRTADHVLRLKKTASMAAGSKHLLAQRATVGTTPLSLAADGLGYAIDITFGTETFSVLFDTGSSDLWLPSSDFECVDEFGFPEDVGECALGPGFEGTLSGGTIPDQNFNITYGDGEFLIGTLGYEDITVAGVTVEKQEVALVNYGYWFGDDEVSGLIGFGYPLLTSAYYGTDPSTDNVNSTAAKYNPFFTSAIQEGKVDPIFSIALERSAANSGPGGQLALGGLPTVDFDPTFVTTPLEIKQLNRNPDTATDFSYYTICPDGFSYTPASNNSSNSSAKQFLGLHNFRGNEARNTDSFLAPEIPVIVDSGTTLNYLPKDVTSAVNKAFSPPSYYSNLYGLWVNRCSAEPPSFAVRIAGQDLHVSSQDMLITPGGDDPSTRDFCISSIQESSRIFILGEAFLKNVVAVFDVGASEMHFAAHVEY